MESLVIPFGGPSNERKVSTATAQHVASVLEEAEAWFWTPAGAVHPVQAPSLLAHERPFEMDFSPPGEASHSSLPEALDEPGSGDRTFVLALHGGPGEDGTVQRWFEERRIAFTGPGSDGLGEAVEQGRGERGGAAAGR